MLSLLLAAAAVNSTRTRSTTKQRPMMCFLYLYSTILYCVYAKGIFYVKALKFQGEAALQTVETNNFTNKCPLQGSNLLPCVCGTSSNKYRLG